MVNNLLMGLRLWVVLLFKVALIFCLVLSSTYVFEIYSDLTEPIIDDQAITLLITLLFILLGFFAYLTYLYALLDLLHDSIGFRIDDESRAKKEAAYTFERVLHSLKYVGWFHLAALFFFLCLFVMQEFTTLTSPLWPILFLIISALTIVFCRTPENHSTNKKPHDGGPASKEYSYARGDEREDDEWEIVVQFGDYLDELRPNILDEDLLPAPKEKISEALENGIRGVYSKLSPEMVSLLDSKFQDMDEYKVRLAMHVKIDPQDRKLVDEINKPFGVSMRSVDEEINPDDINDEMFNAQIKQVYEALKKNPQDPFAGLKAVEKFAKGVMKDPQKKEIKNKYSKLSNEAGIAFCEKQGIDFPSNLEIPMEKE